MKNIRNIFKFLGIALLLAVLFVPDADAARKRTRKASQTASVAVTKKKSASSSSSSRKRREKKVAVNTPTATEATRKAAKSASSSSAVSESKTNTGKSSRQNKNELAKINVHKPDLDAIRSETLNPKSKFFFPNLYRKYEDKVNYTKMTPEEYRYLYLGYMFQEDYDPYRVSPYAKITETYLDKKDRTKADTDSIIKYAEKALKDNPFDLRQMSFLVHVLKEKSKNEHAKIWEYRLENLLGAIKSTGTGENEENAWFVIYPMHEYDMLTILGYEAVDVDYIEPGFDYLSVKPDGSKKFGRPAKGFYFNVQVPQQQYEWKHPESEEDALGADLDNIETEN